MNQVLQSSAMYIGIVFIASVIIVTYSIININKACSDIRKYVKWAMDEK